MAKRSKGKHAAGAADKKSDVMAAGSSSSSSAPVQGGETSASAHEAAKENDDASADASDDAPQNAPDDTPDKAAEQPIESVPAATALESQPSSSGGGLHSAAAVLDGVPQACARARRIAIVCASIVGFFAIIYLAGVVLFSSHYLPNTYIAGINFSLKTPDEMAQTLDETLDGYSFSVVGKGMNFTVTSSEADLSSDSVQVAKDVLEAENPWKWPLDVFQARDLTNAFTHSISASGLSDLVSAQLEAVNATAKMPVNATIAFDETARDYMAVPEVKGTAIDSDRLLETIISGLLNFDNRVVLTDEVLIEPTILVDDPRIQVAIEAANAFVKADFDLTMADHLVTEVDPKLISTWVSVGPELEVAFDDAALTAWASEISSACNTVGSHRSYTRPDGKAVSVAGGTYGWKVDNSALVDQVVAAVKAGSTENIAIPVVQSGTGFVGVGGQDWGSRYVDVDLSEQYARFYDGGTIIWESALVSGNPNKGNSTPQGVWSMNAKSSPATLVGQRGDDGEPEYETRVQYWMPFKGNSVGFHDATWQSSFGGSRYLTNGSHGCVNLPYNAAQALYGIIQRGDVVVVHK
ncbi:L,D-transpeptidase family protein [Adlercreutzia murintestinalis]|uniref:L,D-transpeptidase family protein n=1 Tax=Adlercreutzia murintestinalis TaxID=2941325 RepID=UPI00203EE4F3|nr:L,D-transpeptidase family protein [Adlercreutzia murintestinalis]